MARATLGYKMTLNQLLQNPTGPKTSYMASRARIIEKLQNNYANLIRKHKTFKFDIYKVKNKYLFHFKIPSETHDDFFYDVCLEFIPDEEDKTIIDARTITEYDLTVFSNSPSFMFTYTYICNRFKILSPILKGKCSKKALNDPPNIRNPLEVYGFEKSIYYAAMFIRENRLIYKNTLDQNLKKWNKRSFLSKIKSQVQKLKDYKKKKQKKKRKK